MRASTAGPRRALALDPAATTAAIVTCGGICPGLNTVVRELVLALWHGYGVRDVLGVLGLSDRADVRVEMLSGGQRRRLTIGLALVVKNDLLAGSP